MKMHCAKAYLEHVRDLVLRIQTLQEKIERQRAVMELSAAQYREASSPNAVGDAMENGVIELQTLICEFCAELSEYVAEQRAAHAALSHLPRPEYAAALTGYYVHGKSWEQVCVDTGYSWDGMMSLRRRAIPMVYELMPEEWRRDAIPNSDGAYR